MTARRFCAAAIGWLGERQSFRSAVLPSHKVEDERGVARLHGFFVRASSAGRWAITGLWALAIGAMLAMMTLPGMARATQAAVHGTGYAGQAVGATALAAAEVKRRRNRTRGIVELRAAESGSTTAADVTALHAAANGAEAWLVAEAPVSAETREAARAAGVRCFVVEGGSFREVDAAEPAAAAAASPNVTTTAAE